MAALPVEALWVLGAAVMAGMEKKAQADRDKQAEEQKRTDELSSLRSQVEAMTKQQQEAAAHRFHYSHHHRDGP